MDIDKLKQWMEVTQKYQNGKFWEMIFEQSPPDVMTGEFEHKQERKKSNQTSVQSWPKTDILLTEAAVIVLLELPGVLKEDVFLSISGNKLTVRGVVKPLVINGISVHTERNYGEFQRVIELPEPTDSKHVQARFDNGILAVTYGRQYRQEESIYIQ